VWSAPRPGRFTPEQDPVPIVQEAGWTPGSVWTCAKNLVPTRIFFFIFRSSYCEPSTYKESIHNRSGTPVGYPSVRVEHRHTSSLYHRHCTTLLQQLLSAPDTLRRRCTSHTCQPQATRAGRKLTVENQEIITKMSLSARPRGFDPRTVQPVVSCYTD
jgi:hypothetical protein